MPRRVGDVLSPARRRLAAASFDPPPREAALLLARVLGVSEAALLAHPEWTVDDDAANRFAALLGRRLEGEPVAYLLGEKEFYGRSFEVDGRVLVPRPETEHLVEAAIARARALGSGCAGPEADARRGGEPGPGDGSGAIRILELGTGSGAIAITLALELPRARVIATDVSIAALAVAAANRARHQAPVGLAAARTLDGIDAAAWDLVVANLPYLDPGHTEHLVVEVLRWEPAGALFGGIGGLDPIRDLLAATTRLRPGATLLLEIGADQADAVTALAAQYHLRWLETIRDYAGLDRVVIFVLEP